MGNCRPLILLLAAWSVAFGADTKPAAGPEYDPAEVIKRVIAKVAVRTTRLPRYTCRETIVRDYYRPAAANLAKACSVVLQQRRDPTPDLRLVPYITDRLRLDVTVADKGEIYSWADSHRFEEGGIDKVLEGPFGTGAFSAFLTVVFLRDVKAFKFESRTTGSSGERMTYSFEVPQEASHYTVREGDHWISAPYSGRTEVDPATAEVLRLSVKTGDLPPDTLVCQTASDSDFSIVRIGSTPLLFTSVLHQRFIYPNGTEAENTTHFDACHEYSAESTIVFDSAGSGNPAQTSPSDPSTQSIPAGLPFTMDLTAPIDVESAAAGDAFQARLVGPLRDRDHKILARSGAVVEGRLVRVEMIHAYPQEAVVVLAPNAIWTAGGRVRFAANRNGKLLWQQVRAHTTYAPRVIMPSEREAPAGAFEFRGVHIVVKKGFRSEWTTAAMKVN